MQKLIALSAAAVMASSAAIADIAISGSASVSYDDNGSSASATTYDADLSIVGTTGGTTLTVGMDVDAAASITGVDLTTTIGPVTVTADMFDEDEDNLDDGSGDIKVDEDNRSVSLTMDVPVGDFTVGLDDNGDATVSGTFAGVTITHTLQDGDDKTVASASIAGVDVNLTNDAGATTWDLTTTVQGVTVTLESDQDVTAEVGLSGNTVTFNHYSAKDAVAATTTHYDENASDQYSTVAVSRDLTSGATLTATYSTSDDSLTLKAAVSF